MSQNTDQDRYPQDRYPIDQAALVEVYEESEGYHDVIYSGQLSGLGAQLEDGTYSGAAWPVLPQEGETPSTVSLASDLGDDMVEVLIENTDGVASARDMRDVLAERELAERTQIREANSRRRPASADKVDQAYERIQAKIVADRDFQL